MKQEPLPPFLQEIANHLKGSNIFHEAPNHILLNEYSLGQGIMPHKDGPLYYPRVAILSLSGPAKIEFRENLKEDSKMSLILQPRSLMIFTDEAYTNHFHGIGECQQDVVTEDVANIEAAKLTLGEVVDRGSVRLSLTIRIVPLVLDLDAIPATPVAEEENRRMESFWYNAINEVV